jgi:hypothetical protein
MITGGTGRNAIGSIRTGVDRCVFSTAVHLTPSGFEPACQRHQQVVPSTEEVWL